MTQKDDTRKQICRQGIFALPLCAASSPCLILCRKQKCMPLKGIFAPPSIRSHTGRCGEGDSPGACCASLLRTLYHDNVGMSTSGMPRAIDGAAASTRFTDEIAVMANGKIVENGTFDSLVKVEHGYFKEMYEMQSAYYVR